MIHHAGAAKQANWQKGTLGGNSTLGFSKVCNLTSELLLNEQHCRQKSVLAQDTSKFVKFAFFRSHQNHPNIIDSFTEHLHNSQIERSLEAAQAPKEIFNSNKT